MGIYMTSNEIRQKFLKFFENRGHKIIPSASLIPENDPSVLFNTAGMQPLVPYLMGQKHPLGNRLVNVQKCVRTQDIDEVGDNTHDTFFEMMGNWSLGDYFKEEAISWSYEFLTSKDEGLGLDPKRLYVTVFEGNDDAPQDVEAFEIWKKFIPENHIYFMSAKSNWWSVGENGPCGPDTEMFYDITEEGLGDLSIEEYKKADEQQKVVEIWNDVFMQYEKKDGKVIGKLIQQNVDTGSGLERVVMAVQGKNNIFETDLFADIISKIEELSNLKYGDKSDEEYIKNGEQCWVDTRKMMRIVADHMRTSVLIIADGALPSNTGRGYILRRLLRRAVRFADKLGFKNGSLVLIVEVVINKYKNVYSEIVKNADSIKNEINEEESKFRQTLENGLKEFEKGVDPFDLFQSYGFPIELTEELSKEKGIKIDREKFDKRLKEHQELSRTSSAGMFKGGLANHSEKTIKLHTAHHLLLAGLQAIVSPDIKQKGSNITEERLRMDFICDHKLTDDEKKKVEDWVNDKIKRGLNVIRREMPLVEAEKIGAEMEFGAKYPEVVSLYFIEDENGNAISKEFCGGPHVENTGDLAANPEGAPKHFKIQKEEASSAGVRRIKAVLE
ncbi:MAG: Alanine-tRNA ligase [Candidatus Nomurabacteria bacterium GW2011_GWF2_35_66]|uniref:Alanine--tRNA ligase n=1 Tax=Candidatus Nomurabacteria bacterium GW2011_GWE1_35_16 TaxID=1618761 RepID=A0A0G0BQ39_9BACT|nr:MAG: Alanine-tRNA ligase [Candidatus Nomurabacteria bacterium GW2011_GWF1_34_20]KKP63340.1 MAG: Alanine-tRNA ligase [Candidatus Nomurabacteria bacterium GW2011_GWE2_34_25]KKP65741.1 MAG: Alanine-tRNA ligase [Candidatus Nomurabacteria bacterium GW2011_GWE1_35_16]KKP83577.1 MAG: Alanine-tRNA ligase [Candidatus Nomurabacteria bacterium GW2011_GWF2_35_66]